MTRGNQRELARKKNQKKLAEHGKGKKESGVTKEKRMHSDAEIMRQKQLASQAKKDEGSASTSK